MPPHVSKGLKVISNLNCDNVNIKLACKMCLIFYMKWCEFVSLGGKLFIIDFINWQYEYNLYTKENITLSMFVT